MENSVPPVYPPPPPAAVIPPPLAPKPPAPRRGGRGWMIVALLLMVLLAISVMTNFSHLFTAVAPPRRFARDGARWLQEVVIENNHSGNKIAVLDVGGIITSDFIGPGGANMVDLIADQLALATEDDDVKAVVLKLDTPGGEVVASDEIARLIREFQDKSGKPVVASMGAVAASGGYYVSVPCQWIVAHELTITGSIGVIMHAFNYRGLLDKIGVRPEIYKSGKFKDMLRGSKSNEEILPEERQMIQAMIDETVARFKAVVRDGRRWASSKNGSDGHPLSSDWEDYADGRILSGKQALEYGFVDELGNFDKAVQRARKMVKIDKANLIRYEMPFNLANLFRIFGQTEKSAVKIDVGLDFPKLKAGQLYFLSSGMVH
ncbi:MAG: signal peptide peptidase SppA [Verrucomicrobia bacterium]|nr:signal peptide peptidase SppA [Verrucomicrobiota bacterium]